MLWWWLVGWLVARFCVFDGDPGRDGFCEEGTVPFSGASR